MQRPQQNRACNGIVRSRSTLRADRTCSNSKPPCLRPASNAPGEPSFEHPQASWGDRRQCVAGAFQSRSSTHRADAADAIISKGVESCASVLEFLEVTREPTTMVSMTFESNTGRIRGWGSTSCCRGRPDFDTTLNELFATSK